MSFAAIPDDPTAVSHAIVLVMHLTGVDASMCDAAQQFAREGFAVVVPDLYARLDGPRPSDPNDVAAFMPFAKRLTTESIDADLDEGVSWLRERFPKATLSIAGFCMGGRIAMHRTAGYADRFSSAAIWYGFDDTLDPKAVDIPIVASYGLDDVHIPADKVEAFAQALTVEHDFKFYQNAGHGFFHRESAFAPAAAADSFRRTLDFLRARSATHPR
ncbi:MAG TPA: alpha/beta fold hydrolase [Candidatus Cybelea sp.]|jgi:carboxymethylenebutenolidase